MKINMTSSKNRALSIVGSSRNNGDRQQNDFYPTPRWCIDELLKREKFDGNIWECACGKGDISDALKENGYDTFSSDIIDYNGYLDDTIDFLNYSGDTKYDNIITNPPYKYALDFVNQSKRYANNKIAMFLKTVFLESSGRYNMFQDTDFQLKTMYQFSKRPSLYKNGEKTKNGGMIAYAWYVWDRNYTGKPMIEWIADGESPEGTKHDFF